MKSYQVLLLKDSGRPSNQRLIAFLLGDVKERVEASGGVVFGVFGGLLGLATNEAYLVFSADQPLDFRHEFEQAGYQVKQGVQLNATVRPLEHLPASRQGVYVFRWFDVISRDVEEIVALSAAAWPSFEADFDTQNDTVECNRIIREEDLTGFHFFVGPLYQVNFKIFA